MIRSANDHKAYRHITLDNGLTALLIHDPHCSKSAASLAVNVGAFHDPNHCQGLAHLLEHMMFLGTKKYPNPDEYQQFIRHHGGDHNAWTSAEYTNYHFSIDNSHYISALDRFSQFFIAPLLSAQWVAKEIETVDSEYQLKILDDTRRINSVLKELVNPQHPFSKFSVGNKHTLGDDSSAIQETLVTFYRQHYCSSNMSLVMLSDLSLDVLEQQCISHFSAITRRDTSVALPDIPLYQPQQHSVDIAIIPDKDIKSLSISFPVPPQVINYYCKPLTYLAYLIGHEGKGSLISRLKHLDLANTISAGSGMSGYNFSEFVIDISLTDHGLNNIDQIIALLFTMIDLIKADGIEAWRYTEKHNIMNTAFEFQESPTNIELVSHLSINMFKYDQQDIIYGDYAMDSFEPQSIAQCLDGMDPSNIRILTIAKDQTTDSLSGWYNAPYRVDDISDTRRQQWLNLPSDPALYLPEPNPFIVERLAYTPPKIAQDIPLAIIDQLGMRLWHLPQTRFTVPKGHIFTAIDSLAMDDSPKQQVLCQLYIELLHESLAESTFQAEIAGMHYDIYPHASGVTMHVSGYSPKLFLFFEILITQIRQREFCQVRFNAIKQQLCDNWHNQPKEKPINCLFKGLSNILQPHRFEYSALLEALAGISLSDVNSFIDRLFQQVHLESFVQGDWDTREVKLFGESLQRQITTLAQPCQSIPRKVNAIAAQQTLINSLADSQDQSGVIMYFQSQQNNATETALWRLCCQVLSPLFFSQIRTKQQLGYVCGVSYMPINTYPGLMLYIQSSVASVDYSIAAIDKVLAHLPDTIAQLSPAQWQQIIEGLISKLAVHDNSARQQAMRYWTAICNRDSQFNHRQQLIDAIKHITANQLISFVNDHLLNDIRDRLLLVTHADNSLDKHISIVHRDVTDISALKDQLIELSLTPD